MLIKRAKNVMIPTKWFRRPISNEFLLDSGTLFARQSQCLLVNLKHTYIRLAEKLMLTPRYTLLGLFTLVTAMLASSSVLAQHVVGANNGLPVAFVDGGYFFSRTVDISYDDAVAKVREELNLEGFGVITEIDVRATMKKKLDVEYPPYIILGACNPPFAHEALTTEEWIGTLMPCNVVVRVDEDGNVLVGAMDPAVMASATGNPELEELGSALRQKMIKALSAL